MNVFLYGCVLLRGGVNDVFLYRLKSGGLMMCFSMGVL